MGANDVQTVKAFLEAESFDGASIIIAYSHCIAHGINMTEGMRNQTAAVKSGHWPLYRYDPRLTVAGKNPLQLDYKAPTMPLKDYAYMETHYKMLSPQRSRGGKTPHGPGSSRTPSTGGTSTSSSQA